MKKKFIILCLLLFIICFGCTNPRFYSEVLTAYNKEVNGAAILSNDQHKLVFKSLDDELKNVEHIIYHYSPYPEWNSKQFSGAIYDLSNDKYYYFENSKKHPRKLAISEKYPYPKDNYHKFIIDNFRNGKIDFLKKLGEISGHSGIRTREVIYDINLKEKSHDRYTFEDFLFMNGKPTKNVD